jgi:hypothetical protein
MNKEQGAEEQGMKDELSLRPNKTLNNICRAKKNGVFGPISSFLVPCSSVPCSISLPA